jgi:hypothetical protein
MLISETRLEMFALLSKAKQKAMKKTELTKQDETDQHP